MSENELSLAVGSREAKASPVLISSEAIVVLDVVESTFTSNLFGWYSVGRALMRELRSRIREIGLQHHMGCMKSTGDGYLLTYADDSAAELGAVHAVEAAFELVEHLNARNLDPRTPQERRINVRIAIHFGQVDVVENDREGPHVSYVFRLEGINQESLRGAINAVAAEQMPLRNYILCSEPVKEILVRRSHPVSSVRLGLFRLKGFPDWHEVFLLERNARGITSRSRRRRRARRV